MTWLLLFLGMAAFCYGAWTDAVRRQREANARQSKTGPSYLDPIAWPNAHPQPHPEGPEAWEPEVPPGCWRETLPCGWLTCTADGQQLARRRRISSAASRTSRWSRRNSCSRTRHARGEAEQVAECLRRRLSLPRDAPPIHDPSEQELRENPGRWNGAWVRLRSRVARGME